MIYLASPYSHPDPEVQEARYRANLAAAVALSRKGDGVFSPVAYGHALMEAGGAVLTWDAWMALDLRVLVMASEVVALLLPGWRESRGLAAEVGMADRHGIPVRHVRLEEAIRDLPVAELVWICGGPAEVARRLGISRQAVHRWIRGTASPRADRRMGIIGRLA